jgi:hypothetical protein
MSRPQFEVADVFRRYELDYAHAFGHSTSPAQRRVLDRLSACRTTALGGHVYECDTCGHIRIAYNSCRDRHCPTCLAGGSAHWLDARHNELLPVPYFHVVFTLPGTLRTLALQNKAVVYDLLFRAASETLLQIAADPRHLGAQIGVLAILHTWGQNLLDHPHIHCVVPGGGIAPDRSHWIPCRRGFFLPVRVLARLFRGKLLAFLQAAFDDGELQFHGSIEPFRNAQAFAQLLQSVRRNEAVVYAKPPFGGPEQVLKYLARYTHRVAISNHRLLTIGNGKVTFRWKNYALGNKLRRMTLDATEFIRRFLLHVLPKRFVRIRYYGFLANGYRRANLALCRGWLGNSPDIDTRTLAEATTAAPDPAASQDSPSPDTTHPCPACGTGRLVRVRQLGPFETFPAAPPVTHPAPT